MEHLSDEGADVLALNAAAAFKMLGLIWQSLISSLPLQALNFVEKKKKRKKEVAGSSRRKHGLSVIKSIFKQCMLSIVVDVYE